MSVEQSLPEDGVELEARAPIDTGGRETTGAEDVRDVELSDVEAQDDALDAQIEALDDGRTAVTSHADTLFTVPAREQFAALGDPAVTSEPRVDAATSRLVELPDLPTTDHVEVYDDVHRRLQDALADAEVR